MGATLLSGLGNILSNVLGFIGGNLSKLWSSLGGIALEAFIDAGKQSLQDVFAGVISSSLDWVSEGIEAVEWLPQWTKNALNTFAGNIGGALDSIANSAIGMVAKGSSDILEVTNAQQRYMTDLQDSVVTTFDALLTRAEEEEKLAEQSGVAITDFWLRALGNRAVNFEEVATTYVDAIGAARGEEYRSITNDQLALTDTMFRYLEADLRRVEQMADEEITAAADVITTIAMEQPKMVEEWFLETVVKPVAYGNNWQWALSNVDLPSDEDVKEAMKRAMIMQQEITVEMAEAKETTPEIPRGIYP